MKLDTLYKQRRANYLLQMGKKSVALFFSAPQRVRSNDTHFPYRQDSDFYYLSGFKEDNAVLVLIKEKNKTQEILFVQKKDPKLELWTGKRLGKVAANECFSYDKVYENEQFDKKFKKVVEGKKILYFDLFSEEKKLLHVKDLLQEIVNKKGEKQTPKEFLHVRDIAHKMRLIKTEDEISLMRHALEITKEAHHKVMALKKEGLYEYELQALFEYEFRKNGAYSDAYTTIVAGGNNGNTLHYIENAQKLKTGDLILIDAGCEYEMYASDITRTIPVDGKFTQAQKEIYELVLETEIKVIEAIKEGELRSELQKIARESLCTGMVALGILQGEVATLIKENKDRVYFPHGIGHWIGLDVHDTCPYKDKKAKEIPLQAGMVLTIEPGLYLPADDEALPVQYRGIAVRIEDDILVTKEGYENLSAGIFKSIEDIESL